MIEYLKHCGASRLVKINSVFELVIYIRQRPLQKKNVMVLAKKFKFSDELAARIIGKSLPTYRRRTPTARISISASEILISLSELYELGSDTFGSSQLFINWLNSDIIALGGRQPILFIESLLGIEIIKSELLRIQYGILV